MQQSCKFRSNLICLLCFRFHFIRFPFRFPHFLSIHLSSIQSFSLFLFGCSFAVFFDSRMENKSHEIWFGAFFTSNFSFIDHKEVDVRKKVAYAEASNERIQHIRFMRRKYFGPLECEYVSGDVKRQRKCVCELFVANERTNGTGSNECKEGAFEQQVILWFFTWAASIQREARSVCERQHEWKTDWDTRVWIWISGANISWDEP